MVGFPHDIKGQGIYAYVTLKSGEAPSDALRAELAQWVRKEIGPIAQPDHIQWAPGLPKTRSGKIMRRILRKIAADEHEHLGDTSTLADPAVVADLVANRRQAGQVMRLFAAALALSYRRRRSRRRAPDARDLEHGVDDDAAGLRRAGAAPASGGDARAGRQ